MGEAKRCNHSARALSRPEPRPTRSPAGSVFAFALGLTLLTASGHFYLSDSLVKLRVAQRLVDHRTLSLDPGEEMAHVVGPDGRRHSPWAPGSSMLMLLPVAVARFTGGLLPVDPWIGAYVEVAGSCLLNALLVALITGLLAHLAHRVGSGPVAVRGLPLLFLLTTQAWPLSKTAASEVPAAAASLAALATLLGAGGPPAAGAMARAGILAGIASLFYYPCALLVGAVMVAPGFLGSTVGSGVRGAGWALLGSLPSVALHLGYNATRTGSPWITGYGPVLGPGFPAAIAIPVLTGSAVAIGLLMVLPRLPGPVRARLVAPLALVGLLVLVRWPDGWFANLLSPGQGLLHYSPTVVLALLGAGRFLRERPGPGGLILAWSLLLLAPCLGPLLPAFCYGSRYAFVGLPSLMLLAAPLLEHPPETGFRRGILEAVVALGLMVQIAGVTGSYHVYQDEAVHELVPETRPGRMESAWARHLHQMVHDPSLSSVGVHLRRVLDLRWSLAGLHLAGAADREALRGRVPDFWWVYLALMGVPAGAILGLAVGPMLATAWGLVRLYAVRTGGGGQGPAPAPSVSSDQQAGK